MPNMLLIAGAVVVLGGTVAPSLFAPHNVDGLTVDLDIFNGQYGSEVPEAHEETIGAFTVANRNDSDYNGTIDNTQNTVNGEIDLMQMVIRKPSRDVGHGTKLKLRKLSGSARVWETSMKITEITLEKEYDYSDLPKVVWVEAPTESGTVRDITFEIEYAGATDKVKATGIWSVRSSFKNKTDDPYWDEAGSPPKTNFDLRGGHFGLVPPAKTPIGLINGMGMSFDIKPDGVSGEPGIKIDITRQIEFRWWFTESGDIVQTGGGTYPSADTPNDDSNEDDEDVAPPNNTVYVIDFPGPQEALAIKEQFVYRLNAKEFVRIRVDGTQPAGEGISGSRASEKQLWYMRSAFKKQPPPNDLIYARDLTLPNDIELGQTTIGVFPFENP